MIGEGVGKSTCSVHTCSVHICFHLKHTVILFPLWDQDMGVLVYIIFPLRVTHVPHTRCDGPARMLSHLPNFVLDSRVSPSIIGPSTKPLQSG